MALGHPNSIGILGGTGPAGRAFAARLASVGFDVIVGSRSAERAEEACEKVTSKWSDLDLSVSAADNAGAAGADMVVIATPWDAAASTATECAEMLSGKVLISMANAITMIEGELQPVVPARGSIAAGVQFAVPDAQVVAAMHHVPARELGDLSSPVECDVLVCSDHADAARAVMEVLDRIPGLRPVDSGHLAASTAIEALTAVLLGINARYRTRSTIRLNGLP